MVETTCEWLTAFMDQAEVTADGYRADNIRAAQTGNCNYGRRCPHARNVEEANGERPRCCMALPLYSLQRQEAKPLRGNYSAKKCR